MFSVRFGARALVAAALAVVSAPVRAVDSSGAAGGAETSAAEGRASEVSKPLPPREGKVPATADGGTGSLVTSVLPPRPEIPGVDIPVPGATVTRDAMQLPRVPSEERRLAVAISEAAAVQVSMMAWNRWVGAAPWAKISGDSIRNNLRSAWVLDGDTFWVNQFGHAYQGTWTYGAARSAGLGFWTSAAFPVVQSAIWELTGETTPPSVNDQITTSVSGVVLGEALWRFAEALRADGGTVNEVLAGVLSPMSAINAHVLGRTDRPPPSARWVLELGGIAGDAPRANWPTSNPPRAYAGIDFTWGLPGDPDLTLDEPFDHFVLEASYGAAADPVATIRARGLLVGERLEPQQDVRGLWGLFLSYDFDTTGPYRISTAAVGVGTSGRAELAPHLALEATGIASAVLMGAAGHVPSLPEGRDYRFGPGEQLLLDVRLRADPRVSGGVTFRQYLLVGDGPGNGTELVLEATAGILFRIAGPHAIGAEATRYHHRGQDGAGPMATDGGTALRVYYAIASGG
ncbi:DUF3943 domain-containing protein [Anaeromyxobacter oryzae]|uniref:DUF3943 domain-containing protein n=1 Tax=Anaeromyxobacter oryzae TaxID=2918170 RepID=A0ABN6MLV1_9BACT|nr:DUF3943 domain-containing protein [Anaeromyxobacter oryzae]BDG02018.1 hypothetical protein AMOR_10140 [Anaeromyxobacter oryzae]